MMTNDGHFFFWGGGFMWIFWILVLAGIIFFILNMSRGNNGRTPGDNDSPLEILKKRYARGEIDTEEYEQRRRELES